MSVGLVVYLIMGTTVYLLMFKRQFMVESNYKTPKLFLGIVCAFGVMVMALTFGYLDPILFG